MINLENKTPSEHYEQCLVIRYCDIKKIPIFAIPNANALSSQNKQMAIRNMAKMKKEGLRKGIPDLFIPVAKNGYHGLFIEMKRVKGSTTSKEQKEWIEKLNNNGYKAIICKGSQVAISEIENYFK